MDRLEIEIIRRDFPDDMDGASAFMDGRYIVLLNSRKTQETQEKAFLHEMLHIYRGDHFSSDTAQKCEVAVRA